MKKSVRKRARKLIDLAYKYPEITNFQELGRKAKCKTQDVITVLKSYGDSYNWVRNILDSNLKMQSIGPKGTYLGLVYPSGSVKRFLEYGCARAVIKDSRFITHSDRAVELKKGDILISLTRDGECATYARIMQVIYPYEGIGILLQDILVNDNEVPSFLEEIPMKENIEQFICSYRAAFTK